MPDEILTTKQAVVPQALSDNAGHAMAQPGVAPAFKNRGQRRITRAGLDQWIDAQLRGEDGGSRGE